MNIQSKLKHFNTQIKHEWKINFHRNILNIETETEIKEFIGSLLDLSISRNKIFLDELLEKLKKPSSVKEFKVN